MLKTLLALAAGACVALSSAAQATVTLWDGTGANDAILWGQLGAAFTQPANPSPVVSNLGLTGSVADDTGNMERRDQGNGWAGDFAPGEQLLWNTLDAGTILITFDTPVWAAGAQIQCDCYGPFTARIWVSDGSFFDVSGFSTSNGDDSAMFLGAISNAANIVSIAFGIHNDNDLSTNSFAISQVDLINPALPEPGTWAMMLLGFGAVGVAIRRRRRTMALAQVA